MMKVLLASFLSPAFWAPPNCTWPCMALRKICNCIILHLCYRREVCTWLVHLKITDGVTAKESSSPAQMIEPYILEPTIPPACNAASTAERS
jgi:hypothetical protein